MSQPTDRRSDLATLLAAAGLTQTPGEVVALVRGVLAAPEGFDPDAWLDLIAPPEAVELRACLRTLKATLAAEPRPGDPPPAQRLERVRRVLAEQGVDGLILPLTDEHRNEYVPAAAERLAWLTGFTGSAGLAVILPDRAALFVDGRYTLQAKAQLDPALFEAHHLIEEPPAKWLAGQLGPSQRIGFDPRLHVKAEVERFRRTCANGGAELVALEANPVDAVWRSRPPAPIAPVQLLDERYAGEASADKRARMGAAVAKAGAEVAVLSAPDSIAWLLNIRGGDVPYNPLALAFALLHAEGGVELFIDQRKLRPGLDLGNGVSVQPVAGFERALDALGRQGRAVQVDPAITSVGVLERLAAAGARVIEAEEPCILAKACKNPVELAGSRAAHRRDGAAMCRFLCWLEGAAPEGRVTELDAAARLEQERRKEPLYRGPSFATISAAGPNAALPHYRVSEETSRVLEPGSLYLVDSGGQYPDATTDITRTVALGTPTDEMRRHFTLVLKAHVAIALAVFPAGANGAQLDGLARRPLWQAGLDYDHGTGHGIGSFLCVHEGPQRIAKTSLVALKPGMLISNEPGYYRNGAYGIRTENLVAVQPRGVSAGGEREILGFETLTRAPIDRRLIVADLLEAEEIAWLNNFHARVRADLIDLLEGETAAWLVQATAPI